MAPKLLEARRLGLSSLGEQCYEKFAENARAAQVSPAHIAVFGNPPYGSRDNPITEITNEISSGYGWRGHEQTMRYWLVLLAAYCNMHPWQEIPVRGYYQTSKIRNRRLDLFLKPASQLYRNFKNPLIITEIKSNYIDDADVVRSCLEKNYPQSSFRDFLDKENADTIVFQLVAPAGITEAGVKRLNETQEILSQEFGDKVVLDSVKLDFMVWHQFYPAIVRTYQDDKGAIGQQFNYVKGEVKQLCDELCNPELWVETYEQMRKNFRSAYKQKELKQKEPSSSVEQLNLLIDPLEPMMKGTTTQDHQG